MKEARPRQETGRGAWSVVLTVLSVLGGLSVLGCGGTTSEVVTDPLIQQYRITRVAVLPFTVAPPTSGQERGYATPVPAPEAAEKLAELFYLKLNTREGIVVVPQSRVREVVPAIPSGATDKVLVSPRALGEQLNVDAVLEGRVQVYKERKGSAVGLERPEDAAEVGFEVRLVSVENGVTVWSGRYYERQRPMTEDLSGFLERGARFLTVEELANSAVDHVLREFPLGQPVQRTGGPAPAETVP